MNKKYIKLSAFMVCCAFVVASCSGEDRCFQCVLGATDVPVCESNFRQLAASNNLEVDNLEEYIDLITPTGFVCTEIE